MYVIHTYVASNPEPVQTKDYAIGICCFSAKHAALRRKNKDWLARNHDNVTEWAICLSTGILLSLFSPFTACHEKLDESSF
jgi:hypothetical protein